MKGGLAMAEDDTPKAGLCIVGLILVFLFIKWLLGEADNSK